MSYLKAKKANIYIKTDTYQLNYDMPHCFTIKALEAARNNKKVAKTVEAHLKLKLQILKINVQNKQLNQQQCKV